MRALAGLVVAYVLVARLGAPWYASGYMLALPMGLLIAAVAAREHGGGARAPGWAVKLGRWSFAVYLVQWPVLVGVKELGLAPLPTGLLAFAIVIALSALLYEAFERPVERWLRGRRWAGARVASVGSAPA
jgi:peptidoglycan/LPS O-acetylase OafA/YrhL